MKILKAMCLMAIAGPLLAATPLSGPQISPYVNAASTYTLTDQAGLTAALIVSTLTATSNVSIAGSETVIGASITNGLVTQSTTTFTGGAVLWPVTAAQVAALQATATGQFVWCTNCISANNGLGMPCASTGSTTTGQFIGISSATAVTACK